MSTHWAIRRARFILIVIPFLSKTTSNSWNHPTNSRVEVNVAEGQLARLEVPELVALDADVDSELTYRIADADLFNLEVAEGRAFLSLKSSLGLSTAQKSPKNH